MNTPQAGSIVHIRSRQYLVEGVTPPVNPNDSALVHLSCLEDDAQGDKLDVLWRYEVDAHSHQQDWGQILKRGFDKPHLFSAYWHTLKWHCVTATDPNLFQAPYRAGIEVKAYQLEPLRMALNSPRVNLFIADDVGLGKTIEAGLILREMIMRQKVRRCVVCVPPSVVRQWQNEMEERFGLSFIIYDRDYVSRIRQTRGWSVNPWKTHNRFIISHALVRNEAYATPLRDWLGEFSSGALLILDEAHNVAPASGSKYAIDSKLTRAIRELAPHFEHRLFLSATPHNGHSNSFSALLEILDPQRFVRGVPVDATLRDEVMIRRLKSDLRCVGESFPTRNILRIVIDQLPENAPELALSLLLQKYRKAKELRLAQATKSKQAAAMLVVTSLQKRLLSSIEAFARTLDVHRRSMEERADKLKEITSISKLKSDLLVQGIDGDDERADLLEEDVISEEESQMRAATHASNTGTSLASELAILNEMAAIAQKNRYNQDERLKYLIEWIRENQCPKLGKKNAHWHDRRLLIFTEYADTKRYLQQQLSTAMEDPKNAEKRIMTFHGGIGEERREEIKAAFNADPQQHPLRILIATDAAREGVNLQNHCYDLFHFDIPWNPGRLEQRNGRIDRKLQKSSEVNCYYFVLPQRTEDRVLDVLVQKTNKIHEELGSLSPVIERNMHQAFRDGIDHQATDKLTTELENIDETSSRRVQTIRLELGQEQAQARQQTLENSLETLRTLLDKSRKWIGFDDHLFRKALSASLETLDCDGLKPLDIEAARRDPARARYTLPLRHDSKLIDPTWAMTLDALRTPKAKGQSITEWRREAPIRPIVFRDPGNLSGEVVHLHLEHRVVQRLLGRFLSMGFRDDDLRRACVLRTDEAQPKVVLLGRVSLFGQHGTRLHDEITAITTRWVSPKTHDKFCLELPEKQTDILQQIETALKDPRLTECTKEIQQYMLSSATYYINGLAPNLSEQAKKISKNAEKNLEERGKSESQKITAILKAQRKRIQKRQKEVEGRENSKQLKFDFNLDEEAQLEADRKHWLARLEAIDRELKSEPERIKKSYEVKVTRVEPIGLIYLWPLSS